MKPNSRRLDPAIYPYHFEIPPRFSDVDPLWHLNNVRLMELYQESRVMFHRALRSDFDVERKRGSRLVVAHQSVDFLREVRYPGTIRIGVGILKVGTSSYTLGAGLFQADQCASLAMTVLVNVGPEGTATLPATLVEVLRKHLLPEDAR